MTLITVSKYLIVQRSFFGGGIQWQRFGFPFMVIDVAMERKGRGTFFVYPWINTSFDGNEVVECKFFRAGYL